MFSRTLRSNFNNFVSSYRISHRAIHNEIGVIGVPFSRGQAKPGVIQAPTLLRNTGIFSKLESMGYDVQDFGDQQFEVVSGDTPMFNIKNPRTVGNSTRRISKMVQTIIGGGKTCLTLGGDHSLTIGTLHGHAQIEPNLCVVWVDAHADINPPLASVSGNIHGMVLSFLMHELVDYIPHIPEFSWCNPCISAKSIAYIGLRDIDPAERYIIEHFGIPCYTMHDIDRHGIDYVLHKAMDAINPGLKRPIHLSFDIDSLDPHYSPSTGTPVYGGLSVREGMFIAEELALTDKLTHIDLVEVNPSLGDEADQEKTVHIASEIITACFGKRRKGNTPSDYELPKPVKIIPSAS